MNHCAVSLTLRSSRDCGWKSAQWCWRANLAYSLGSRWSAPVGMLGRVSTLPESGGEISHDGAGHEEDQHRRTSSSRTQLSPPPLAHRARSPQPIVPPEAVRVPISRFHSSPVALGRSTSAGESARETAPRSGGFRCSTCSAHESKVPSGRNWGSNVMIRSARSTPPRSDERPPHTAAATSDASLGAGATAPPELP